MAVDADHAAFFVKTVELFVITLFVWHTASSFLFSPLNYLFEGVETAKWEKGGKE